MSKLETETRNAINDYYQNKIKEIDNKISLFTEKYKKERIEEFNNNKIVEKIRDGFVVLKDTFKDLELDLECKLYTYGYKFKFDEVAEYQLLKNERDEIYNEKRKLVLTLENNPKTSKEFKNAINEFMKKL